MLKRGQDLKSFLRRHPEIRGRTRTDELVREIQKTLVRDLFPAIAGPQLFEGVQGLLENLLDGMVTDRRLEKYDIQAYPSAQAINVMVTPMRSVERLVLNFRLD